MVAVDANRPAHPKPEASKDPAPPLEPDDEPEQPDPGVAGDPGPYEVVNPDGLRWRL